jgi:hypothetical protein
MDTVWYQSPVFGLDQAPVSHRGKWRGRHVDELMCRGAESKSAQMKSGWGGLATARETLPE